MTHSGRCPATWGASASAVERGAMPMKAVPAACVFLSSFATSAFAQNYSVDDLARRTVERRAVEAIIWGMPVVNTDLMYQQMLKLGSKPSRGHTAVLQERRRHRRLAAHHLAIAAQ
jgi:hypothetical protein